MKLYYPLIINLYQLWPLPVMTAQQYNVGRGAVITLTTDNGTVSLEEEMVNLYAKRPDGNISYLPVRVEETKIYCDFTEQMLSKAGRMQVELQMVSGAEGESTDITTPIFIVDVQPSNLNARAIEGSDEFIALRDALLKANSSIALAEKAAGDANTAANAAEAAAGKVNTAVSSATSAASAANTAAGLAESAAAAANKAASSAVSAVTEANAAAAAANEAAEKIPKLKPIATSGKASDVAIDPISGMEASDVQAALAEQYSKMATTSATLASALDENFWAGDYEQAFYVYRTGNMITLGLSLNTKNLTGNDIIAPAGSIPVEYRPPHDFYFPITARDAAYWAAATYYNCAIRISINGSVAVMSGTHKSNITFVNGIISYAVDV